MINFDFNEECTGCRACGDICPKSCISFKEDKDGFIMPLVNKDLCVGCGRCEQVCPSLNFQRKSYEDRKCYSVYHKTPKIRQEGSSGSFFYALAEFVIYQSGVVYAAAMDENLQVRHTRATDMHSVVAQMKSKYIQSDTSRIYRQVVRDLQSNHIVLFVGTPCQCQALHNIIPSSIRNQAIIVDIICHGVPSQHLFNESVSYYEEIHDCKVIGFSFREKTEKSLRNYKLIIRNRAGQEIEKIGDLDEIPFCIGYFNHIIQRNSCYNCKQRSIDRVSDLTIGDFWGVDKIDPLITDFNKGYSSVIVNSTQGREVLDNLTLCFKKEIPKGVQFVEEHNRAYTKKDDKSSNRYIFFICLRTFGYALCERYFLQQKPYLLYRLLNSFLIRFDKIKKLI